MRQEFTVRSIVTFAKAKRTKILLAAPTGRAAKRLTELTGHEAGTIHRLLELKPGGDSAYDKDKPLDADLVVVDEASMLDLPLANKLMKRSRQAPTCCSSGMWTCCRRSARAKSCETCSRQARRAPCAVEPDLPAGQQVGCGDQRTPDQRGRLSETQSMKDFFHFEVEDVEDVEDAAKVTVDVVVNRIPARFGLNPRRDIQVRERLAAMITAIFEANHGTYGYRRVHAVLPRSGELVSDELVRELMRNLGLASCQPRPRRPTTTEADQAHRIPDLVARDFTATEPGTKLVGDIAYLATGEGWGLPGHGHRLLLENGGRLGHG